MVALDELRMIYYNTFQIRSHCNERDAENRHLTEEGRGKYDVIRTGGGSVFRG